jgi:LPS-assembly protein
MIQRRAVTLAALVVLVVWARPALAQTDVGPFGSCKKGFAIRASAEPLFAPDDKTKVVGTLLRGAPRNPVTIECDDTRVFADEVEWREADEVALFRGNVVLSQSDLNVAAEKAEFHRATRNGTFYNATGTAHLTDRQVDRSLFGTLEPEVAFRAEKLEKIGPRTYRLTNGGFTTCAQPTPRWHMTGSSGTIVLDKRAVLKNAVLRVKDVPVFYVPLIYYPLDDDDRSTGFLLPTYSTSSIKGTGLSNAFFWAIDRSQDATFYHDFYSKTGMGYGGEYRFSASPGSNGDVRLYILDEDEQVNEVGTVVREAHRTYDLRGQASVGLPRGFRLYGRSEYVSDITTKQLYQQNLAEASRRDRFVGFNLNGNIGRYRIAANVEQRDAFLETPQIDGTVDQSTRRQGQLPKVNLSAAEKPIGRSRVYFGVNGETANLVLQERLDDPTTNHSLWRFDAFPTMRFPFSRLPYLTATAAGSWRLTHWLESKDPLTGVQSNIPLTRQLLDLRMNVTGPIVQRIFQTADNGYADRFKHVIRPTFNVRWLSPFDDFDNVVKFDQVDYEVGGTTTVNYGITNELMARRKRGEGRPPDSRTILTATVSQSYYTKAQAAQYDVYYQTGSAQKFSPLAIDVDARPADHFSSRFRMEIHPQARRPQLYSVSSMYDTARARFTGGWRKRPVILGVPGFELTAATHYLNANASLKLLDNRVGGSYGFDYDIKAAGFVQQRLIGYYNAQCCGISMDYQHAVINGVGQPNALKDRRFGISFTLAGIGSFANPFGAFGDNSGRR